MSDLIAFASLIFSLYAIHLQKSYEKKNNANLEIVYSKKYNSILKADSRTYGDTNACFTVSFINSSAQPISIYKITFGDSPDSIYQWSSFDYDKYERFDGKSTHTIWLKNKIDLPLVLAPYHAVEKQLFFKNAPKLAKGDIAQLYFHTSRGVLYQPVLIDESHVPVLPKLPK